MLDGCWSDDGGLRKLVLGLAVNAAACPTLSWAFEDDIGVAWSSMESSNGSASSSNRPATAGSFVGTAACAMDDVDVVDVDESTLSAIRESLRFCCSNALLLVNMKR